MAVELVQGPVLCSKVNLKDTKLKATIHHIGLKLNLILLSVSFASVLVDSCNPLQGLFLLDYYDI